jgi:DNA-directed RNA polymerase specialized sigma subunit
MKKTKAEYWLEEYKDIPKEILRLNQVLSYAIEARTYADGNLAAATISDMPRGTGTSNKTLQSVEKCLDNLRDIADKMLDDIEDTKEKINRLIEKKNQIDAIWFGDYLTKEEKRVIELRYFEDCDWRTVARKMNYSERQVFNIHNDAIRKINQKLKRLQ